MLNQCFAIYLGNRVIKRCVETGLSLINEEIRHDQGAAEAASEPFQMRQLMGKAGKNR